MQPGGSSDQELEAELEAELVAVYRRAGEDVVGVFKEKLQGFEVEMQQLCSVPPEKLDPAAREKRELVLYATAYLESLFAEEGERLIWDVYSFMRHKVPGMMKPTVVSKKL